MTARDQFLAWVTMQAKQAVVLWRGKGFFLFTADVVPPLVPHGHPLPCFDCSGLVTCGLQAIGGPDMRATHNARLLFSGTEEVGSEWAIPGDLVFYGTGKRDDGTPNVEHVAISLGAHDGRVLSADGATSHQQDYETAANARNCRIRIHDTPHFRADYIATHRNRWLEEMDHGSSNV